MTMWAITLCVLITVASCHEMHRVRVDVIGESALINCSTDLSRVSNVNYWLVPNHGLDIARPGYNNNGVKVTDNGWSVVIDRVKDDHLGTYLCRTDRNADITYTDTELFLYIPTFLEVYEKNLIIGASAAAVVLVVTSLLCVIHSCRYSQRKKDKEYEDLQKSFSDQNLSGIEVRDSTLGRDEYHNAAYENVDMEEVKRAPDNEEGFVVSVDNEPIPDSDGVTTM